MSTSTSISRSRKIYVGGSLPASGGGIADGASYDYTSSQSLSAFPTQTFLRSDLAALGVGSTFAKANFEKLSNSSVCDWKGSTTGLRSGIAKHFRFDGTANGDLGNARGTYGYDTGASGYERLYYRMTARWGINPTYSACQWKMFRHNCRTDHTGGPGPEVVDGNPPQAYWSNSTVRDNMPYSQFTSDAPGWVFNNAYTQAAYNTSSDGWTVAAPQNQWFLLEHFFQENSNTSTSDGVGMIRMTLANGSDHITATTSNRLYRGPNDYSKAAQPFRYFVMQNYFGNATDPNGFGESILDFYDLMVVPAPVGGASPLIFCDITDGVSDPVIQPWDPAGCSGTARRITANLGHLTSFSGCTLRERDASGAIAYSKVL